MNEVVVLAFWPADLKTIIDIIGTIVTAGAVIIGGLWAYFRFVKDRVYRPRLEVGLFGQWREIAGKSMLHARVTVKNIGSTDIELMQEGTALIVESIDGELSAPPTGVRWKPVHASPILEHHEWIEPNETISDDLLLRLDSVPEPVMFRCVLRWKWGSAGGDIVLVVTRKIIPVESTLDGAGGQGESREPSSSTN